MSIYDLLKDENKHFWDFLDADKAMFSQQALAYWEDEENNKLEELEEIEFV